MGSPYSPLPDERLVLSWPADRFTRVHKFYPVRNAGIKALEGNLLTLAGGTQVPVGVQHREAVLRLLHPHLVRR